MSMVDIEVNEFIKKVRKVGKLPISDSDIAVIYGLAVSQIAEGGAVQIPCANALLCSGVGPEESAGLQDGDGNLPCPFCNSNVDKCGMGLNRKLGEPFEQVRHPSTGCPLSLLIFPKITWNKRAGQS